MGGGGGIWSTTFSPESFIHLTSELMLKNRIRAYIMEMSFNILSVKSANTLWLRIFQAASYMSTYFVLEYSRPHVFEYTKS